MTERYASALTGGGVGTEGDPWTFTEAMTALEDFTIDNGDRLNVKGDGTYVTVDIVITRDAAIANRITIEGYLDTIGDGGRATIQRKAGEVGGFMNWDGAAYQTLKNFIIDGNNVGDGTGDLFRSQDTVHVENCEFKNSNNDDSIDDGVFVNCYLNNVDPTNVADLFNCIVVPKTAQVGIDGGIIANTIVVGGVQGFRNVATPINCIAYGCTTGYYASTGWRRMFNCIFAECTTGVFMNSGEMLMYNCNFDNNGTDIATLGRVISHNQQNLASQFKDPGGLDFTRVGTNLDNLGFSEIGMIPGVDYNVDIGPDQKYAGKQKVTGAGIRKRVLIGGS